MSNTPLTDDKIARGLGIHQWIEHARDLEAHAEALQDANKRLCREIIESNVARINTEAELAAIRPVVDHLRWILPMAKGYAAAHNVGRNQEKVNNAESALADLDKREGKL